jgi:hypothetical protein
MPPSYPCESLEAKEGEPSAWWYNWATLFLGDVNTETWSSRLGSLETETVKYDHELGPENDCADEGQQQLKTTDRSSRQRGRPT